ncbi:metal-dependent hydrolase [Salinicola acroporae]|uniref:Hydrolase n=1 Tax=Salinicola acroporae TaxID=1541440 RepID=A0ABT6I8R6_9GAMM|nr:metal-dependent hydrolase [Salinicola acroporae]MDH4573913.1 hydrolase [Salinicola acroporae]
MDSVTQACLGAAIGGVVMPRLGRRALLIGAALGTLPDLDVLIDYGDAVADYTRHRGFSHSLIVLTGVATLLAGLAARWSRTREIASFQHWWWLFTLCLTTHPLLDAFTTYGTQLLWPIPLRPISWHTLFIIDPLYTLPLLTGVIAFAIRPGTHRLLAAMLGLSCLYIGFSLAAQAFVEQRLAPVLAQRGMSSDPILVQPAPLTTLLWRVTVIHDGAAYEGWVSLLDGDTPPTLAPWPLGDEWQGTAQRTQDGQRLSWFSGPFLRYQTRREAGRERLLATDLRLGVPGAHPFTFSIAEREDDGRWRPVTSERAGSARPDRAVMQRLLARITSSRVEPITAPD